MNNQDRYFKGQNENEEFICFYRRHWITLLQELVYFMIFVAVVIITMYFRGELKTAVQNNAGLKAFFVIGFMLGTAYIHRFFVILFNHFVNVGIITDMRIVDHKKTLFFTDTVDAIDMINIQNMEQKGEGLLPNILGYGDINIYLTASATVKVLEKVPNAKYHFRCISRQKELHRYYRDRAGLEEKYENSDMVDQQRQILLEGLRGTNRDA